MSVKLTFGQRFADAVASGMGSWKFIIIQSTTLVLWVVLNVIAWRYQWDPYPFIFLNLMLSFQAAYAAPFIMMAQNRQSAVDRRKQEKEYHLTVKAESEILSLHLKLDQMREKEMQELIGIIKDLLEQHKQLAHAVTPKPRRKAITLEMPNNG